MSINESCDRLMALLGECDSSRSSYLYRYDDHYVYDKCMADCMEAASCDDRLAPACNPRGVLALRRSRRLCGRNDEAGCIATPTYDCSNDAGYSYSPDDRCYDIVTCATDSTFRLRTCTRWV
jgi:hypothetical protein